MEKMIHVVIFSSLMVMVLYQAGEFFTDYALDNSKKSISSLMELKADYANLITPSGVKKTTPQNVKKGDIILIKPGEKIPLDGIIVEGSTSLDTSNLTVTRSMQEPKAHLWLVKKKKMLKNGTQDCLLTPTHNNWLFLLFYRN